MITKVQLRSVFAGSGYPDEPGIGPSIDFVAGMPSSTDKYLITSIDGLDPVKADLVQSTFATLDGVSVDNARKGGRNIVMKAKYLPNYVTGESVQDLRRATYAIAGTKKYVEVTIISDDFPTVYTYGTVETNDVTMFSKDVDVQFSIVCNDAYLRGATVTASGATGVPVNVTNAGDAATGFQLSQFLGVHSPGIDISFSRTVSAVVRTMSISVPGGVGVTGDTFVLSTVAKDKYLKIVGGGSLLPYVVSMDFFPLEVGVNSILVATTPSLANWNLSFVPLYEGL